MAASVDYLTHLADESRRFVEVLRPAPAHAPVPSCPGWDAVDLLWHLGSVQSFWADVVEHAVTDPAEVTEPARPEDRPGLVRFFEAATARLQRILAATDPAAPRWTWSTEQTAGFTRRRQAQEALVHRVDAELTAGVPRAPMDPALAADGVDEALRVVFGGCPPWGRIEPIEPRTVRLTACDVERTWLVTLARFTGTDPHGVVHDEPDISIAPADPGGAAAAELRGTAADLDCYLWGRPPAGEVKGSGDAGVLSGFDAILRQGVQ